MNDNEIYKDVLTKEDLQEALDESRPDKRYYWLEDDTWAARKKSNRLYLDKLRKQLQKFLYSKPVKVKTYDWIDTKNQLGFQIGPNTKTYKIDPHLSVYDFCHRLEREFLKPHYPMYQVINSVKRDPTEYEIKEMVFRKDNPLSFMIAASTQIEDKIKETGIIDYVEMRNGIFRLNINGNMTMRCTENVEPFVYMRLSEFLDRLKNFETDKQIRDFIYDYSIEKKDAIEPHVIEIDYSDDPLMVLNFFTERSYDLYESLVYEDDGEDNWWSWGRFRIYMPDESLKDEVRTIVKTMRSKLRGK